MPRTATTTTTHATPSQLWTRYRFSIMVERLTGGIPANERLLQAWLETNGAPAEAQSDQAEMLERLDPVETHGVVFYRAVDGTPCYESRCMKAAFKEAANILKGGKDSNAIIDIRSLRSKVAERVFVGPNLVPITSEIHQEERPLSVMTMQGPRTSLKRFEYADDVPLSFTLKVLNDGMITEEHLRTMLEYLQDGGIGADRSQGSGTFELTSFEKAE